MALKNIIKPYHLMVDGDMSGNLTSALVDVTYTDNVGIQLNFTGTPTGVFAVEGSVDYDDHLQTGNWSELTFSTTPSAVGAADVHLLNLNQLPYKKIRVTYTESSGSGTLNIYVMSKGLN
jgi:hypothetical protein